MKEENDLYEFKDKPSIVRDDGMTDKLKLVLAVMVREVQKLSTICLRNVIYDYGANIVIRILILLLQKYKATGQRLPEVLCYQCLQYV